MSWSPDFYIGEMRPWPDAVHVVRGNTGEARRYTPERKGGQEALERRIDELCQENERLRQELAIRESSEQEKVIDYLGKECADWEGKYLALAGENSKLRWLCRELSEFLTESEWLIWPEYRDAMHELGIEVPNGEA